LGPHRWSQTLNAHHRSIAQQDGDEELTSQHPLTPLSSIIFPRYRYTFRRQFLVPGGRFLFAYGTGSLFLFDLGQVGRRPLEPPLIVAQERLEECNTPNTECSGLEVIGGASDDARLRVGLVFSGGAVRTECVRRLLPVSSVLISRASRVVVYDIFPGAADAAFIKLSSLSFSPAQGYDSNPSLCGFHLRHDYVYLRYRRTGVICDFVQRRYCEVPFRCPDEGRLPFAVCCAYLNSYPWIS
jgi:hypothetical protein